jgi:hypothetical protein
MRERVHMRVPVILAISVVAVTCARDNPVAPEAAAASQPVVLELVDPATVAAVLEDAEAWLLPSLRGHDVVTDGVAVRFSELASGLERAGGDGLPPLLAAARHELEARAAEQPDERSVELAALGLVLDRVEAAIQGRLQIVSPRGRIP